MKTKPKLNLYVWENVLQDWSCGIMFALAESEEHARKLLLKQCHYIPKNEVELKPKLVKDPQAFIVWGGS